MYLARHHIPSATVLTLGNKVVLCCKHTELFLFVCSFQHHGGRFVVVVADGAGSGGRGGDDGGGAVCQVVAVVSLLLQVLHESSWRDRLPLGVGDPA